MHHDRSLDRTTALGGPISAQTVDDLRRARVPALADVLSRYCDPRIIVEMKVNSAELAAATIDVIRRADAVDRVCLGSFGLRVLRAARAIEPALATSGAREEDALGAVSLTWCRWPVTRVGYGGLPDPRACRAAHAWCRRASSRYA